jgi:hypothetical protein
MINELEIKQRAKKAVVASFDTAYYKTSCLDDMSSDTEIGGRIVVLQKDFKTII